MQVIQHSSTEWIAEIDSRSRLAGSNMMEVLLFSLGTNETFGMNVFKVREVLHAPAITPLPNSPPSVRGVVSLRGSILPVISLRDILDHPAAPEHERILIVAEFARHLQAFLVSRVIQIVRVPWDIVHQPNPALAEHNTYLTALFRWDNTVVSLLDVEMILSTVLGEQSSIPAIERLNQSATVFFADDSAIARKEIIRVLDSMGIRYHYASSGKEAWAKLNSLAQSATLEGTPLHSTLNAILLDIEMPEMDGYTLAQTIKADHRFAGIPIIMHSSLSSQTNRTTGFRAGADYYVAKFDPIELSQTIRAALSHTLP
ncbi:MAG: chemotaxis protein [Candidatus Kapabacteria bacterium]|nr:chemotaxis protein [Candidatus Kapabacteria bacterium]